VVKAWWGTPGYDYLLIATWLSWLALRLFYLLGGRNRVSTLINLTYRYVAWGHGGAVIVGDEPSALGQPSAPDPGPQESTPLR
jgi:hypothetical protein